MGHPPAGTVDTILAERIVDLLNDMYRIDPVATEALVEQRIRCNNALAAHPTITVQALADGEDGARVGLLGVLNGLCGMWTAETAPKPHLAHFGPICAEYDDSSGRLTGFALTERYV